MKNKIIVLQGVPASGKSFYAKKMIEAVNNSVIVCRDSIRESRGKYWVPEQEDYISDIEEFEVRAAIKRNLIPIIDATNLNPKTIEKWKNLARELNCEIEFKLFEIDFKTALERDSNRERQVGKKVLENFFRKYFPEKLMNEYKDNRFIKEQDQSLPEAIICDIDGTVALRNGRSPYDLTKVSEDTFDPRMKKLLGKFIGKTKIIFVSGREGTTQCKNDTIKWISENFVAPTEHNLWEIYFRNEKDYRSDSIVKEEIYKNNIEGKYNILAVFDDRDKVVKMWRDLGLLCNQVYYGDF